MIVLRVALAAALTSTALLKVFLPSGDNTLLPEWANIVIASGEASLAFGLLAWRSHWLPAAATACMMAAGLALAWVADLRGSPCGCFGSLRLSLAAHATLAASLGIAAVWLVHPAKRSTASASGNAV